MKGLSVCRPGIRELLAPWQLPPLGRPAEVRPAFKH
ncbi:unnamed protein product [Amoebophrya sp. A120]|nr:unnamed protein product [Amoebophrya sp. A120]|eukprot:GSA120T00012890001.1